MKQEVIKRLILNIVCMSTSYKEMIWFIVWILEIGHLIKGTEETERKTEKRERMGSII